MHLIYERYFARVSAYLHTGAHHCCDASVYNVINVYKSQAKPLHYVKTCKHATKILSSPKNNCAFFFILTFHENLTTDGKRITFFLVAIKKLATIYFIFKQQH